MTGLFRATRTELVKTFTSVAEYWLSDKDRAASVQAKLGKAYLDLMTSAAQRLSGEATARAADPSPRDKRFQDPEWKSNQFFDFVMQAYLLTTQCANDLVKNADGLDAHTRKKAEFYVQQVTNAISPSNFVLTNPEVLRQTLSSNADNLVRGMTMLAEDIEAGRLLRPFSQSVKTGASYRLVLRETENKTILRSVLV